MNYFNKLTIIFLSLFWAQVTTGQYFNTNPDSTGYPWIVGLIPEYSSDFINELNSIPELELTQVSSQKILPITVDNSMNKYMRPIFTQIDPTCGPSAGIGYCFTYEINRLRNIDVSNKLDSSNWYPTHFTWNFLNNGNDSTGAHYISCWDVVQDQGCPSVETWGGMAGDHRRWMSGYEKYDSSLYNRIKSHAKITCKDTNGLFKLKHWLSDHNEGDSIGGLVNFIARMFGQVNYQWIPEGSPEAGKWIIIDFGTTLNSDHAMTIVGYNDSIKYDYYPVNNGDGVYHNDIDQNGDSIVDIRDWEIGAVKVANSWGTQWQYGDSGYVYIPYRLLAEDYPTGLKDSCVHLIILDTLNPVYEPQIILKLRIEHPIRRTLSFEVGRSTNTTYSEPQTLFKNYPFSQHTGGLLPMQGVNNDPIEILFDYSCYFNDAGKVFLRIREQSAIQSEATIYKFSLVDNRWGEEFELDYEDVPVEFTSGKDTILMAIEYDLLPDSMNNPFTHEYNFPGNMICRRQCTLIDSNQASFSRGVNLDFYNGTLTIEEDAELILGDSVTFTAKREADSLIVYGDLQIGRHVSFVAEGEASLVIDIRNPNLELRIVKANFENIKLIAEIDSLCIDSCTFTDSYIEFQRTNDQKFVVLNSQFDDSYVTAAVSENSIRDKGTVIIKECSFENSKNATGEAVIDIEKYKDFELQRDSLFYNEGTGIKIYYSGSSAGQNHIIKDCYLKNINTQTPDSSVGIIIYHSYAEIELNHISEHNYGVTCFDKSNVQLLGCDTAGTPANTQHIFDNLVNQVYAVTGSFPFEFEYNSIYNNQNSDTLVYYNTLFSQSPPPFDVRNNDWGSNSLDTNLLHPPGQYLWDPEWEPGGHKSMPIDKDLFYQAVQYIKDGDFADAESNFKEIIEDFPDSKYVQASVKELLVLKRIHDQDFAGLQTYLDSISTLWENDETANVTEHVINWCNIEKEDFEEAIAWFESQIEDPVSYADSICAIIDLVYTYTLTSVSL